MFGLDYEDAVELPFRRFAVEGRWCVHSYYTLNPYAPDGSGRLLVAGCDLETKRTEVLVLGADGTVLQRLPGPQAYESFWHTGLWQSWSKDGRSVYFQDGTLTEPVIARADLTDGSVASMPGGMEGCSGEPVISAQLGMLYAAGYGTNVYTPALSPVPFTERSRHGLFRHDLATGKSEMFLSTQQVFESHPARDHLHKLDADIRRRLGGNEGLTLMLYCVRWNRQASRFLFFFGNHCVVKEREEPRISYVFTADRELRDIGLAVDLSAPRRGCHWGWHPDGQRLIGYGTDPEAADRVCLAQANFDGSDYRRISRHNSHGHPGISPADHDLLVTDESELNGNVAFIDLRADRIVGIVKPGRVRGEREQAGRNPCRVCHHPVFNVDGTKVLANSLASSEAAVCEIVPPVLR